jgi:Uma2 family endonuclease
MSSMTALAKPATMTSEEFLIWAEAQHGGRFELIGGEVVAMAPEVASHGRAKFAIALALKGALAKARVECEAFVDGLSVRIDDQTTVEPDALVNCGERAPPKSLYAPSPIIVVEVISPSSKARDLGEKFIDYFRVPSIQHYLVVDPERRLIFHHRRGEAETIVTALAKEGTLNLEPPGIAISVDDVFAAL